MQVLFIKVTGLSVLSIIVAWIVKMLGGWDNAMSALLIFMVLDYVTGVMLALVWKRSNKSRTGKLDSRVGFKGICKKVGMLFFILIAVQADQVFGMNGVLRLAVIMFFISNEALSVIENLKIMGVPVPQILADRFEQKIKERCEDED